MRLRFFYGIGYGLFRSDKSTVEYIVSIYQISQKDEYKIYFTKQIS